VCSEGERERGREGEREREREGKGRELLDSCSRKRKGKKQRDI